MMITAARVDNITNPYQTKAKKVLCLCEDSVTMERAFA